MMFTEINNPKELIQCSVSLEHVTWTAVLFSCSGQLQLNIEAAAELPPPQKRACRPKGTRTAPTTRGGNSARCLG